MGDTVNIRLTAEDKIHLQQRMDETGKKATEVFKSAIYFTEIDADLVDEIISNIGYYASEKNWEGVKEEVHRYVLYRTQNDKYETLEDLKHLLQYILRLDKTAEDSQRANTITNTLAGCQPAMIPNEYLCDPSAVYHLMLFAVRRRQKGTTQFAKHRIVSFAATDCILPQDVVSLAERIASIYAKNGFITAYGIHADRFNVHIHFAVCAVSFQTQNMFHIQWEAERKMLVSVTNQWKSEFDEMLQNNIQMRQSREAALYGDDIVRYGSVPITAKGQMVQNRRAKIGK